MQTPMPPGWQRAQFGGAFATVVRKAGRGAKTKAGDAIVVTCAGEHVQSPNLCRGCRSPQLFANIVVVCNTLVVKATAGSIEID